MEYASSRLNDNHVMNPRKIWETLKVKMSKTCDRESCWLKHKCIKENVDKALLDYTFSPPSPEEWKKETF